MDEVKFDKDAYIASLNKNFLDSVSFSHRMKEQRDCLLLLISWHCDSETKKIASAIVKD